MAGFEELAAAQARWPRVARRAKRAGVEPTAVFAVARAIVCGWWQQEDFWQRERVWRQRLECVADQTAAASPASTTWPLAWWRLVARDAVIFPELVTVAGALVDPALQQLAVGGPGGRPLVRRPGQDGNFVAALGARLERGWLSEVEQPEASGALQAWMSSLVSTSRSPSAPGLAHGKVWWVRAAHRPVEVGAGLRLLAEDPPAGSPTDGRSSAWRPELWVPRRAGQGGGLKALAEQRFEEGLEHARAYAARHGHLALAHAHTPAEGFDLGRWLANRRATAARMPPEQTRLLAELDEWWNPPWQISWQRAWYRARAHTRAHGTIDGGDNLAGLPRWLGLWLRRQIGDYPHLIADQQHLLAQLGLTAAEVDRLHAWPSRRRPVSHGLDAARAYAARHGHLAVSQPTTLDGFALGKWLNFQRHRQRTAGRPTRLGHKLAALDPWWNPPWPLTWQRSYCAAHHHTHGLPEGVEWWPGAPDLEQARQWLSMQQESRPHLQDGQQELVDALAAAQLAPHKTTSEISDAAWRVLAPLLPAHPHTGGRWRDHRQIMEGIAYILRTGQPWKNLPHRFGPWNTCYRRYRRWITDGTLHQLIRARVPAADRCWQDAFAQALSQTPGRNRTPGAASLSLPER